MEFADWLGRESRGRKIMFVAIGSASATGPQELNAKLAKKRSEALLGRRRPVPGQRAARVRQDLRHRRRLQPESRQRAGARAVPARPADRLLREGAGARPPGRTLTAGRSGDLITWRAHSPSSSSRPAAARGCARPSRRSCTRVLGRPLLAWPLEVARALPAARRGVIVGFQAEAVAKALPAGFEAVLQEQLLGTGHAVRQARRLFAGEGDTVVLSGDTPLLTRGHGAPAAGRSPAPARDGELPHGPAGRPRRLRPRGARRARRGAGDRRARRRGRRDAAHRRGQRRGLLLREPLSRPRARAAARRQPPAGVLPHRRHRRGGARRARRRRRALRRPGGDARGQRPRAARARPRRAARAASSSG